MARRATKRKAPARKARRSSKRKRSRPKKPARTLIRYHLERASAELFELVSDTIREKFRGKPGIYALYRNESLYYVGLASSLHRRLRRHRRDRHAGRWNRFSVYMVGTERHLKELETLLRRLSRPQGNRVVGRLPKQTSLKRIITAELREMQRKVRQAM